MMDGHADTTGKPIDIDLSGITLEISDDKLEAHLIFPQVSDREQLDPSLLLKTLQEKFSIAGLDREILDEAVNNWNDGNPLDEKVLIAKGTPPVDGTDGTVKWSGDYFSSDAGEDSDRIDYYDRITIPVVKKGEVIAVITFPTKAINGVDVNGNEIKAKDGNPAPVKVGDNVIIEENGRDIIAEVEGQISLKNGVVSVREVLEISGDVDYDVGRVDFPGTVIIKGDILDDFSVKAGGELHVNGLIEAAVLESGSDMVLKCGASGKMKGRIICGGKLMVRHLNNFEIETRGDVEVSSETVNCLITTRSMFISPKGRFIGSKLRAAKGADVGVVGSDSSAQTKLVIGRDFLAEDGTEIMNTDARLIVRKAIYQGVILEIGGRRMVWEEDCMHGVRIRFDTAKEKIVVTDL